MNPIPTAIVSALARHGFVLQGTGGNCTAYVRDHGDVEELITRADDPSVPTSLTDACRIGTYEDGGMVSTEYTATLAEILTALGHPSREYVLLELRLANGFAITGGPSDVQADCLMCEDCDGQGFASARDTSKACAKCKGYGQYLNPKYVEV